jgi:signal transduction histidine kinase
MLDFRRSYNLLCYLFLSYCCLLFSEMASGQLADQPMAKNGVIDLRHADLSGEIIPLNGEWAIYWKQLLRSEDSASKQTAFVSFPQLWTKTTINGLPLSAVGYASYKLIILLPRHQNKLALQIPDFYTSYRLFVNGVEFADAGNPDSIKEKSVPKWIEKTEEITTTSDTLRLLLQVANFLHSKGGPYKAIELGDKEKMFHTREVDEAFDLVLTGCWFMGGLFFLGLYFFGRHDKSLLYFSLFALAYSYRIIGTRLYVLHSIFPHIPWAITLHMEYLSFFSSIAFFTLYTWHLYPKDANKYIIRALVWLCFIFSAVVILFSPNIFTRLINPFLVVMVLMIAYGFYIYVRAWRNKRVGATYALMSTCVVLIVFVVIILQYFQIVTAVKGVLFAGYISFFFLQSLILSFRYTHALKQIIAEVEEKRKAIETSNAALKKSIEELNAAQTQLIQTEKMASLGELTAGIAHEIQNPLNFVNNFSDLNTELIDELKQEIDNGNMNEVKAMADNISDNEQKINFHGKRADAIVKGMLQHSRKNTGQKELTDINALADEYLRLAYHGLRAKDKSFNAMLKTNYDETINRINIIPQDIGRLLLNLFNNAFYAITEKKREQGEAYKPTVSVSTKRMTGKLEVVVRDNGNGIPKKVLDKIFQPFFTTKPTGQGTGLGLSLSYDIIKAHGGEIKVNTMEGEFTEFVIQMPVST